VVVAVGLEEKERQKNSRRPTMQARELKLEGGKGMEAVAANAAAGKLEQRPHTHLMRQLSLAVAASAVVVGLLHLLLHAFHKPRVLQPPPRKKALRKSFAVVDVMAHTWRLIARCSRKTAISTRTQRVRDLGQMGLGPPQATSHSKVMPAAVTNP